jgi:general stress protein YciG
MPGTHDGGLKTAATIKEYDPDHYEKIGRVGGLMGYGPEYRKGGPKAIGFAADPDRAKTAGKIGGTKSRRSRKVSGYADLARRISQP